jgi:hypothetical protein
MYAYERSLEQLGHAPRYLSSEMIKEEALRDGSYKLLILPQSIALSDVEVKAIEHFSVFLELAGPSGHGVHVLHVAAGTWAIDAVDVMSGKRTQATAGR